MTPDEARSLFLPLHGLVGVAALVGGFGALATRKGSAPHRALGRLFALGMAGAIVAAIPVLVATGNVFLTGMGGFAGYMTFIGWRVARAKDGAGGVVDRAVAVAMIGVGLAFAGWGLAALVRGVPLGLVPVAMGLGAAAFARSHLRWFGADPATRERWVAVHLGAIGGGLIAGITAFAAATLTNWVPAVPEPVVWLAPTVILGPLLRRLARASSGSISGA